MKSDQRRHLALDAKHRDVAEQLREHAVGGEVDVFVGDVTRALTRCIYVYICYPVTKPQRRGNALIAMIE